MLRYLFMASFFLLFACHAYELRLEDPLFNFKDKGIKRILVLPFESQPKEQVPAVLTQAVYDKFLQVLTDLKSSDIIPKEAVATLAPDLPKTAWDLSPAIIKQLGAKTHADIIVSGKVEYKEKIEQNKGWGALSETIPGSSNISTHPPDIVIELQLSVQFWDTQNGQLALYQQAGLRDFSLPHQKQDIEDKMIQVMVHRITDSLLPYYSYH